MKKWALICGVVCVALMLGACATGDKGTTPRSRAQADKNSLTPPAIVDADRIEPRTGDALQKALKPLDLALADIPRPDFLTSSPAPSPSSDTEPPLAAQLAYLAGREAWLNRQFPEAVRQLDRALALDPESADILRMLGHLYARWGNSVRAALYLKRAVLANPNDLESVYLLARYSFAQQDWPTTVAMLAHTLSLYSKDTDPVLWPMVHYMLGSALEQVGYDSASVEQYRLYLDSPLRTDRSTTMPRELGLLLRQRGPTWEAVGDAAMRLNDPGQAADAYQLASDNNPTDPPVVAAKLAYVLLRMGKGNRATDVVIQAIRAAPDDERALGLAVYLKGQGVDPEGLVRELTDIYNKNDHPGAIALTLASLLPADRVLAFLTDHLREHPGDTVTFSEILSRVLERQGDSALTASHVGRALQIAIRAADADPPHAEAYITIALRQINDPVMVEEACAKFDSKTAALAGASYLRGVNLIALQRLDEAKASLQSATDLGLLPARLALVRLLTMSKEYDRADQALKTIEDDASTQVVIVRAALLRAEGKTHDALDALDNALATRPGDVDLSLEKADILTELGRALEAEQVLNNALDQYPDAERVYAALFNLYRPPGQTASLIPNATQLWVNLLQKAIKAIPDSRLTRRLRAQVLAQTGEMRRAEEALRELVNEDDSDAQTLNLLLEVLRINGKLDEATAIMDKAIEHWPRDPAVLMVGEAHYAQRVGDTQRALELTERRLMLEPPSPERDLRLSIVYLSTKRNKLAFETFLRGLDSPEAEPRWAALFARRCLTRLNDPDAFIPVMNRLIKEHPDSEDEVRIEWAVLLGATGHRDKADEVLLGLLKKPMTDPLLVAMVNNQLGYTWAFEGRRLDEAQRMIQTALDLDPQSAAFLDSMGWVLYKKGQFGEAVGFLEKAVAADDPPHSVILEHLGDAYYRLNRKPDAVAKWKQALDHFDPDDVDSDTELRGLDERVRRKIDAVDNNTPAPVADVPNAH
ncbi:MAG: tetratricopeptide repeat protein [Phycisphaera sp.]|nr:tetratricopeptide repeat protein [Phycisphaera sp.]